MAQIIDGRALAEKIKDKIVKEVKSSIPDLKNKQGFLAQKRPNLAIILVGDRPDSVLYVNLKEKEAKKVGIDAHTYKCAADIPEPKIFEMIKYLNEDKLIDAILVQLPLPQGFDTDGIIQAINPAKDVDRFHPNNLEILFKTCDHTNIMPPVFEAVLAILDSINYDLSGQKACVLSNSEIFGRGLAQVLSCRKAETEVAHLTNINLKKKTVRADILISALGQPNFITKDMVKKGAVVIDIGISRDNGKIKGDVDFKSVKEKADFITPVPGGVGPLTIAMLFKNTLALYKQRNGQ